MSHGPAASEYAKQWCELIRDRLAALDASQIATRRLLDVREAALRAESNLAEPKAPMVLLRERLGLRPTEERALWVLVAHEMEPEIRQRLRALNTEEVADVSSSTLRRVAFAEGDDRSWVELAMDAPLRRLGLVDRTDATSLTADYRQTFAANPRVLSLAHGSGRIDAALNGIATDEWCPPRIDDLVMDPTAVARIEAGIRANDTIIVCGALGAGRRSLLGALAARHGKDCLVVDCARLSLDQEPLRRELRTLAREARLLERTLLFQNLDVLSTGGQVDRVEVFEEETTGLVLATSARPPARRWKRTPMIVELPDLTAVQRALIWRRALPEVTDDDTRVLATMYPLTPAFVIAAGDAARKEAGSEVLESSHVQAGVAAVLDHKLSGLATRIRVTQTWKDFVLPVEQVNALIELVARIRQRSKVYEQWGFGAKVGKGLGVSALFSGPPGTGKTMAAGLLAADLRVPLYQVDLSKITSKYIGETEKNLAALFDAAEAGHAILLFDEADSLFGKRTEVKSSTDRYANQETNFLLQRMETFKGVCILTTNHDGALDEAFRRRLSLHVRFPVPEVEERRSLWRAMLPPSAPLASDVAFDHLAERFEMSGGYIRNAVLRAAFLAADRSTEIDTKLLLQAATLEYEAMGKIISSSSL